MWSRVIGIGLVLLLVAAAAWALWPRPVVVEVALIDRAELTVEVEEEGSTRIRDVYRVSAPVSGRLTRLSLHVGDPVSAGEIVASIQPPEPGLLDERSRRIAEATLQAATAAVTLAEANLAQAEAQRQYADVQLQRTTELAEKGLVSTQREQQVQLEAATARDGVTASEAALAMRRQELASAQAALIEGEAESAGPCCTEVRSPTTGNVLAVLTESAQVVSAGMPLLDIGDPTDLEVVVDVLSSDAVTIPERAEARIDRWGGEPLRAAVKRIDPVAVTRVSALGIEEQRTRVVLDLLDGPQVRPRLGHGFRVVAMIAVWRGNVLAVPLGALFRQGDDWVVFVVEDGRAQLRTIEIGRRNNEIAEVVAGLEMGDQVIVHPADTLESGSAVVTPASGS